MLLNSKQGVLCRTTSSEALTIVQSSAGDQRIAAGQFVQNPWCRYVTSVSWKYFNTTAGPHQHFQQNLILYTEKVIPE
jgi:hypothetical protein